MFSALFLFFWILDFDTAIVLKYHNCSQIGPRTKSPSDDRIKSSFMIRTDTRSTNWKKNHEFTNSQIHKLTNRLFTGSDNKFQMFNLFDCFDELCIMNLFIHINSDSYYNYLLKSLNTTCLILCTYLCCFFSVNFARKPSIRRTLWICIYENILEKNLTNVNFVRCHLLKMEIYVPISNVFTV